MRFRQKATRNIRKCVALVPPFSSISQTTNTRPARLSWVMILGTFSDFWNGDHDAKFPRTEGPFLTHDMWNEVLPKSGFSGVDIMVDSFAEYKEAAIIFARATEEGEGIPRGVVQEEVMLVNFSFTFAWIRECEVLISMDRSTATNHHPWSRDLQTS